MLLFLMAIEDKETRGFLEEIYLTYSKNMFDIAFDILKNKADAEDCMQDSILKLEGHIDRVVEMETGHLKRFVFVVTKNVALNQYRKNKNYKVIEKKFIDEIADEFSESAETLVIRMENINKVYKSLKNTHEEYAEIISLRYFYGLTAKEISDILCITNSNATTRLSRAVANLRKEYMRM